MIKKFLLVFFFTAFLLFGFVINTFSQSSSRNDFSISIMTNYSIHPNITYSIANNTKLNLDIYLPKRKMNPNTTLIYFHGGGWVEGKKESSVFNLLPYLAMGWTVINVEYRLGRNSPAPAAVVDCRCALRWVVDHAAQYKLDPTKIVLSGSSAGGHLALITGMLPANSPFDHSCPTPVKIRWTKGKEPKIKVAAIINWYGISDVADLLKGPNAKHYAIEWFGCLSNPNKLAKEVSPLNNIRPGLPPILSIHGDSDRIVPYSHSKQLHSDLDKIGIPNKLLTIKGRGHGGFLPKEMSNIFGKIKIFLRENNLLQ